MQTFVYCVIVHVQSEFVGMLDTINTGTVTEPFTCQNCVGLEGREGSKYAQILLYTNLVRPNCSIGSC